MWLGLGHNLRDLGCAAEDTPFPLAFEEFYLPTPLRVSWPVGTGCEQPLSLGHRSSEVMDAVQKVVNF